jgi:hypothetical protein
MCFSVRSFLLLEGLPVSDVVSRSELDDRLLLLSCHVARAESLATAARDENLVLRLQLEVAGHQIRELQRWVVPMLSAQQRELLGVELRRGVGPPVVVADVDSVFTPSAIADGDRDVGSQRWCVGDSAFVVFREPADPRVARCWDAFRVESEAIGFALDCERQFALNDCDAPRVSVVVCRVTAVDAERDRITNIDEHWSVV